uniref:Uncharacterized protein n=1 Tax=Zonotrichia albicollis TaxID=44394 RepID=A0A8D2N224_ZONAL
ICLDKCNHCKHLYDLGFCFYFEAGAFLFTSSLKTKNCFCKEMRFFFNFLRPFVKQKKSYFFLNHFRFSVVTLPHFSSCSQFIFFYCWKRSFFPFDNHFFRIIRHCALLEW